MKYPETPAELFDLCHELFGIGDFDDDAKAGTPWFKVRGTEIAKLKAIMTARRIEARSMGIAAYFCSTRGIPIKATWELIDHITPALIEVQAQRRAEAIQDAEDRLNHAIAVALEQGQQSVADQLMRMSTTRDLPAIEKYLGIVR